MINAQFFCTQKYIKSFYQANIFTIKFSVTYIFYD